MPRRTRLLIGIGCAAAVAAAVFFGRAGYSQPGHGDWGFFQVGARSLVHYRQQNLYAGDRWHLYLENPDLQIGPPALWLVAASEGLRYQTSYLMFAVVMVFLGCLAVGSAALTAPVLRGSRPLPRAKQIGLALAGIGASGIWAFQVVVWRHLDDAIALSFATLAAFCIARGRPWWLTGLLLGTAAATKPWAVILAPMLLGLPRRDRAKSALVAIAATAAWWAPFIVAAPTTIQALGHFAVVPRPGSVLALVGLHGRVDRWLRPAQFTLGLATGAYVARRRVWAAAPLAALATRVLTDPYAFAYYGLGPLVFAYLFDCAGGGWRGLPCWTAATAGAEFLPSYADLGATWIAAAKLTWAVMTLLLIQRCVTARRAARAHPPGRARPTPLASEPSLA